MLYKMYPQEWHKKHVLFFTFIDATLCHSYVITKHNISKIELVNIRFLTYNTSVKYRNVYSQ